MNKKVKDYEKASTRLMDYVRQFDGYTGGKYSLPAVVYSIRILMLDENIRKQFIGKNYERFSQGFCALNSNAVYDLTGGAPVWEYYVLSREKYPKGPVAYLHNKLNNKFLYLGDLPDVPYELGHAIKPEQLRGTPNIAQYLKKINQVLDY